MANRSWRQLSIREMSYGSQKRIAAFLDAPNSLNWKDLLSMMPEYGPSQMQQLSSQEMRGKSPTICLLNHMSSTGKTVGELYEYSEKLGMKRICELIISGLRDRNIKVDDIPPSVPPPSNSRLPPSPSPPLTNNSRFPPSLPPSFTSNNGILRPSFTTNNSRCSPSLTPSLPPSFTGNNFSPSFPPTLSTSNNNNDHSFLPSSSSSRIPPPPIIPSNERQYHVIVERPLRTITDNNNRTRDENDSQAKRLEQNKKEFQPNNPSSLSTTSPNDASITSSTVPSSTDTVIPSAPLIQSQPMLSLSYDIIKRATGDFDEVMFSCGGHKLGKGGFGTVFHGQMDLEGVNREVAVKVFSHETDSEVSLQFKTELHTISRLKHPNLLPLLGYSCNHNTLCLVYPYMPLGSLDKHLNRSELGGQQRLKVIRDIASGLHYLHTGCGEKLVHRDVKSANILLDANWQGILTDFGVARTLSLETTTVVTQRIVGTQVYMAPEYCTGLVSPAADVFSLGIVILELLFGCLAIRNPKGEDTDLLSFLDECEDDDMCDLFLSCWSSGDGVKLQSLAEQCTDLNRHARPTMEDILRQV